MSPVVARARHRTRLEIGPRTLHLAGPDGRERVFALVGTEVAVVDASFARRFVRHMRVWSAAESVHFITPPEDGAIAPRALQLPRAPEESAVIDRNAFETVHDWLACRGRLDGRTIEELALLTRLATSGFAVVIGERAAHMALEAIWPFGGPMRGAVTADDVRRRLRPLELAARDSERASEALLAATSRLSWAIL